MGEIGLLILFFALLADWYWGEPTLLWARLPHPVVWFGKAVSIADQRFNLDSDDDAKRYRKGSIAVAVLILFFFMLGVLLSKVLGWLGYLGLLIELFFVFVLLAQRSLMDHVGAVANGLRAEGVEGGRKAVAMIVGRDPSALDRSSIARAAIESLAENFSDGVVAPAFWYAIFGLPGIFAYKMINTADSMIGYHNERYENFGKTAAQIDDLANWAPARISALLIAAGAFFVAGFNSAKNSLMVAFRDAGLHRSPNAGWPESAMAGAADFALGGPRIYPDETVQQAYLNASGKRVLDSVDINFAMKICQWAFFCFAALVLLLAILF